MSDFIKMAYEAGRVKNIEEAFKNYPKDDEWHHGEIEYFINDKDFYYSDKCQIGDIVFAREYTYSDGTVGHNHMFVIVESDYQAVPIEYFGMILSSKLDKIKYDANILLKKDDINGLTKDSIIKTDYIYKLLEKQIVFKVGKIDIDKVERYKEYFNLVNNKES